MDVRISNLFIELRKYLSRIDKKLEILDLGVGDGAKTLLLAKSNAYLTCIDISKEKIKKLKENAGRKNIKVKTLVRDIRKLKFTKSYDVIILSCILHYFDREIALKIIRNVQKYTKPKGFNFVIGFTELDPGNRKGKFFLEKGELRKIYDRWKILKYIEFSKLDKPHEGYNKYHTHSLATIIAKKP